MKKLMLVGMPNCGKSTVFNLLTGKHAHTGNRAGVTVEKSGAVVRKFCGGEDLCVVDLPGIRSLAAVSEDEKVTLAALQNDDADAVLFLCDATDPGSAFALLSGVERLCRERSLPLVAAFNFCDELSRFPPAVPKEICRPVAAISARTGQGIGELRELLCTVLTNGSSKGCAGCRGGAGFDPDRLRAWLGGVAPRTTRRDRVADRLFCTPLCGYPLFFLLTAAVLLVVFGKPGELLTGAFRTVFLTPIGDFCRTSLRSAPTWVRELVCSGVLGGVGAVAEFLPRLSLLFLCQSVMEQTGLTARFSRLWDRPMRLFGLRGDAMTPLLLGFGCSVPAIFCTRAMKDRRCADRCAGLVPVVACSARLPLCQTVADAFFGGAWFVTAAVWLLGAVCFLLFAALLHALFDRGNLPDAHGDKLPRWRMPTLSETLSAAVEDLLRFFRRAGGIILLSSVLIFLLSSVTPRMEYVGAERMEESLLSVAARWIAPLFAPLGFADWRAVAALLAGIGAKESSLSALGILTGGGEIAASIASAGIFTPASALSFTVFYSLYFPCTATLSALRAEKRPRRYLPFLLLTAYLLSAVTYRIGSLLST